MSDMIDKNTIVMNIEENEKEDILSKLIEKLYEYEYIDSKELFLEDVLKREELGVTGMGNYIAIPHGKSKAVKKPGVSIGILNEEVEWESLDDKGVKVIILLCVPADQKGAEDHLKILAQITKKLAKEEVISSLINSKNKDQVVESFNI